MATGTAVVKLTAEAIEELQETTMDELFDEIDLIDSDPDYEFVEKMEEKVSRGDLLTDTQWVRVQRLHQKYVVKAGKKVVS